MRGNSRQHLARRLFQSRGPLGAMVPSLVHPVPFNRSTELGHAPILTLGGHPVPTGEFPVFKISSAQRAWGGLGPLLSNLATTVAIQWSCLSLGGTEARLLVGWSPDLFFLT